MKEEHAKQQVEPNHLQGHRSNAEDRDEVRRRKEGREGRQEGGKEDRKEGRKDEEEKRRK